MRKNASAVITTTILVGLTILVSLPAQGQQNESATTITANPVPLINQPLVPDAIKPGSAGFTLTVNGTGFVSGSVVKWNGSSRTTIFVSRSQLKATILSTDITKAGTASVTVFNPSPGGGTSNPAFFEATGPTPSISLNRSAYSTGSGPQSIAIADFNGDGRLDLAVANLYSNTVSVLLGKGDGTFQTKVDYATGLTPTSVAVGDFNGDGRLDLVVTNAGDNTLGILLGNGDGTFQAHVDYPTGTAADSVAVADLNRDGKLDLVTANLNSNNVSVLLGNGNGTFRPHADYATPVNPYSVAVADFNRDGKLDLVTANEGSNNISVLLGNGDGTFEAHVDYSTGTWPFSLAVADFNGDDKLDLAVANFGSGNVSVLLGNGDGTFQSHVDYGAGTGPYALVAEDFNGDGKLDIAVANTANVSLLLGRGDGTFQAAVSYGNHSYSTLAAGDFNRDGRLDLAAAASVSNAVSVLLQSPTVSFSKTGLTFSNQVIETSSTTQAVTLTNTGYLALKISNIGISGPNAGDFSQIHTCGSALSPGGICTISVTFKPTAIGPRSASVTVADNGVGSPQSFALRGTGVVLGANATLSAKSLSFVPQIVGTTSPPESLKLSNYGTTPLSLTITTSGDFSQSHTCAASLATGASCTISVSFKPTQAGSRSGTLSLADNAPGSPQKVPLSGTGAIATTATVAPSSMSFSCRASLIFTGCSPPQNATLTNTGTSTLYIIAVTVVGQYFAQTNHCPSTLGPGQSCAISVSFDGPASRSQPATKTFTGTLFVYDTTTASPQKVSLTGVTSGVP